MTATRLPHRAEKAEVYWQALGPHVRVLVEVGWLGRDRNTAVLETAPDGQSATITYKPPWPGPVATHHLAHLPHHFTFERAALAFIAQLPSRMHPSDFLD